MNLGDDVILKTFEPGRLKLMRGLVPAVHRYFDFLGVVDCQSQAAVDVQVYGPRTVELGHNLLAFTRRAIPRDLSLDLGDRKSYLRIASVHEADAEEEGEQEE